MKTFAPTRITTMAAASSIDSFFMSPLPQETAVLFECIDANLARFGHRSRDLVGCLQDHGYTVHQPVRTRWIRIGRDTAPLQADLLALHGATRP